MKQHKKFIEIITKIEKEFDVNSLIYDDVNIWPLIRLELVDIIMNNKKNKAPIIHSITNLTKRYNELIIEINNYFSKLKKQTFDILLLSNEFTDSYIKIDGKDYNRFIDSFYDLNHKKYNINILNIKNNKTNYHKNRIDITLLKNIIRLETLVEYNNNQTSYKIDNLSKFLTYLQQTFNIKVEASYIVFLIINMLITEKYFTRLFSLFKAKYLALRCYYSFLNFGILLSAKKNHIQTIDLQHGIQNDYHYMYTHCTQVPKKGYELLPTIFLMWGEVSKSRILKWIKNNTYHKAYVSGNSFLANLDNIITINHQKNIKYYTKEKIHILIALQTKEFYMPYITDIINKFSNDDNIVWHFKEHPLHKNFLEHEILNKLTNKNIEYSFTTNSSIYEIKDYVDIVITHFSSVAYELYYLSKIPIIFTQKTLQENTEGIFYIGNADELQDKIHNIINNFTNIQNKIIKNQYFQENYSLPHKEFKGNL